MKKKILPVIAVVVLIVLIAAIMLITNLIERYTPSTERQDLGEHYGITAEDQVAILLDHELADTQARLIDGHVYLDYNFIRDFLNERFYWDANENILLYTTASDLVSASAESTSYLVTKNTVDYGHPVVKATSDSAYVDIDFVNEYSDFTYSYYEEPSRLVITSQFGEITTATAKKNTEIRIKGGIKSPILADVSKSDKITILEPDDSWTKVSTEDGVIGYIRSNTLSAQTEETLESDFASEEFTHIRKDFEINMGWHQVTNRTANNDIATVISESKGMNVIAPTWFYLNDNNGNIADLASSDYVNYCHQHNVEVWGLVSNLENSDVDSEAVLTHTSTRQNLVNQILSAAIQYNLDGINLDFEALDYNEVGDAYIQFVRELSLKCENNGIVLSIDNYVPTSYTAFYNRAEQALFADYVVIMGYDEHYAGSEAGSVASINWVKEGVANTLAEVPAEQIILGMPFYTRIWSETPVSGEEGSEDGDTEVLVDTTSSASGMSNAARMIAANGADKIWLEDCGQFYSEYTNGGVTYRIWLEDATSIEEKLKVMDENGLAGAAFWKLGLETSDVWDTIIKYIN